MLLSNNNFVNIKGVASLENITYGDGNIYSWLHQNNNYLCKFAYGYIKQGDTFIAYGNGAIWKVNNKVYAWMTSGSQQYVIIDVSGNNYSYNVNGKYSLWRVK